MKSNGLIIGICSIIIGIVVVTAVMIPIVDSAMKEPTEVTNTGTYCYYEKVDSFTLSNGELNDALLGDIIGSQPLGFGLVITDAFIGINYKTSGNFVLWSVLTNSGDNVQANVEVINNEYTLFSPADNSIIETGVLTFAYIPSVTGDYGIIGDAPFTLNKSDNIVFVTNSSSDFGVSIGTPTNMDTVFKYVGDQEVTDYNPTINYVWSDDGSSLEVSRTTGAQIIAPITTIVYEESDGIVYTLVGILPIFVVIGLLVSVMYVIVGRR